MIILKGSVLWLLDLLTKAQTPKRAMLLMSYNVTAGQWTTYSYGMYDLSNESPNHMTWDMNPKA